MFELPEFATLARQINETVAGKVIRSGALGNSPHKFVWYNQTHEEFAVLTPGKTVGHATAKGKWMFVPLEPAPGLDRGPAYILLFGECGGKLLYHAAGAKLPEKYHLWLTFEDSSALTAMTQMWGAMELYEAGQEQERQYVKGMRVTPVEPEFTLRLCAADGQPRRGPAVPDLRDPGREDPVPGRRVLLLPALSRVAKASDRTSEHDMATTKDTELSGNPTQETLDWLLAATEPWTRYRTLVDLVDLPTSDAEVQAARRAMLVHPQVQDLLATASAWSERPLKRHNDAAHPLYALSTLADFGLRCDDPGMAPALDALLAHQSGEGAFQSLLNIGAAYGGTGSDSWTWALCDAPTVLYCLLAMGLSEDNRVQRAVDHLAGQVDENGWRCRCSPELGKFRGPGRKSDPCPIANVYALKALSFAPAHLDSPATRQGAEMLLNHWEYQADTKYYLFGIGSDFRKLKYPFVWYDILHVVDVLSRFPFVRDDPRFADMLDVVVSQAGEQGRYTAGSMYQAWKGWSFAEKKQPSPWLTYVVLRIRKRIAPAFTTELEENEDDR